MTRRNFLKGATCLTAAAVLVPSILKASVYEANERPPHTKLNFIFGAHIGKKDTSKIQELLGKADVYCPEYIGWDSETQKLYQQVADGEISPAEYFKKKNLVPDDLLWGDFTLGELEAIHNTGVTIRFVDIPKKSDADIRKYSSIADIAWRIDLTESLARNLELFEKTIKDSLELQFEREHHIKTALTALIKEYQTRKTHLKNPHSLNILVFLGSLHDGIQDSFSSASNQDTISSTNTTKVSSYYNELLSTYRKKEYVRTELLIRAFFENYIDAFIGSNKLLLQSNNHQKVEIYKRIITSKFSIIEIKEVLMDKGSSGQDSRLTSISQRNIRNLVIQFIKEKGLSLPQNEQELDVFLRTYGN